MEISVSELEKVPYLVRMPTHGRAAVLRPFFEPESGEWHFYHPVRPGELGRIAGGEPVVGSYLARDAVEPHRDFPFALGTFVVRHISFPRVVEALDRLQGDVCRFAEVLAKYDLIAAHRSHKTFAVGQLLSSELEYLLLVIRSSYDLLQKVAKAASEVVKSVEDPGSRLISDLPDSFRKVVMSHGQVRTQQEIESRFNLPPELAAFYAEEAPVFERLRTLRDSIAHHGASPPTIFETADGAAILIADEPWSHFDIWSERRGASGQLGSARALFAHLVQHTLGMTARYVDAYSACIGVLPDMTDELHYFIRHPLGHRLVDLEALITSPWEGAGV